VFGGNRIEPDLVSASEPQILRSSKHEGKSAVVANHFIGHEWQGFLMDHKLFSSTSRQAKGHDNVAAGDLSPMEFEKRHSAAWKGLLIRGNSSLFA